MQHAREGYAAWQKAKQSGATAKVLPSDSEAIKRFKESLRVADVNERAFGAAFWKTDFENAWSAPADRALFREGLRLTAEHAYLRGEATTSVRAADLLLARMPDDAAVPRVRGFDLPSALVLTGDLDRALREARAHAKTLPGLMGAKARFLLGDLELVHGNHEAARAAYDAGYGLTKEPDNKPFDVTTGDWDVLLRSAENDGLRIQVEIRRRWLEKEFPKLKRVANVGPVNSVLKARPLLLWLSPGRDSKMLEAIDALKVSAVAVTWMQDDPFAKEKVTASTFRLRLRDFRKKRGLACPFTLVREAQGDALIDKHQRGLLVLLDAKDRVAFVSRPDGLLNRLPLLLQLIEQRARRLAADGK